SGSRITFASTVKLEDEAGKEYRYWIVGSDESDPSKGRISILSPLARTLIGKNVGDSVTPQLPNAKKTFALLEPNFTWKEKSGHTRRSTASSSTTRRRARGHRSFSCTSSPATTGRGVRKRSFSRGVTGPLPTTPAAIRRRMCRKTRKCTRRI